MHHSYHYTFIPLQDIYPKRVPSPIQRERRKHARELELFLRERYGRERRRSQYRRNLINVNNWATLGGPPGGPPPPLRPSYTMATSASNHPATRSRWLPPRQRGGGGRRRRQRRLRDELGQSSPSSSRESGILN